jgi:hypothetical protein
MIPCLEIMKCLIFFPGILIEQWFYLFLYLSWLWIQTRQYPEVKPEWTDYSILLLSLFVCICVLFASEQVQETTFFCSTNWSGLKVGSVVYLQTHPESLNCLMMEAVYNSKMLVSVIWDYILQYLRMLLSLCSPLWKHEILQFNPVCTFTA